MCTDCRVHSVVLSINSMRNHIFDPSHTTTLEDSATVDDHPTKVVDENSKLCHSTKAMVSTPFLRWELGQGVSLGVTAIPRFPWSNPSLTGYWWSCGVPPLQAAADCLVNLVTADYLQHSTPIALATTYFAAPVEATKNRDGSVPAPQRPANATNDLAPSDQPWDKHAAMENAWNAEHGHQGGNRKKMENTTATTTLNIEQALRQDLAQEKARIQRELDQDDGSCLGCLITGVATCTGLAGYFGYLAMEEWHTRPWTRQVRGRVIFSSAMAVGWVGLGAYRLYLG